MNTRNDEYGSEVAKEVSNGRLLKIMVVLWEAGSKSDRRELRRVTSLFG